ncbi:helix-turn-helix domain-containing protein [Subtercola vilae]|uniref:XRE family transcriptional regulator n=1 Tax=Subtercola vilae TaxID=2056433 RepID=A0A4T2BGQ5_9MICO|nr:helix-turn-helix transcriptional regulator [Subtercola vilae]TIH29829.1 XRE family transcriptional regulator [Subtercola vilae]
MSTPFRELEAASLAAMTTDERARFDTALEEEETRLRVAEMVYQARSDAGLTQAVLAERVGTKQSVISAIENGSQMPTIPTLRRIARAVDRQLTIELAAAS